MSQLLSIGELFRITGCKVETIRFYEQEGLLACCGRSAGGHRRYNYDQLARLKFITRTKKLGFSMQDTRALMALADGQCSSIEQFHEVSQTQLASVREKLCDIQVLENVLCSVSKQCSVTTHPELIGSFCSIPE